MAVRGHAQCGRRVLPAETPCGRSRCGPGPCRHRPGGSCRPDDRRAERLSRADARRAVGVGCRRSAEGRPGRDAADRAGRVTRRPGVHAQVTGAARTNQAARDLRSLLCIRSEPRWCTDRFRAPRWLFAGAVRRRGRADAAPLRAGQLARASADGVRRVDDGPVGLTVRHPTRMHRAASASAPATDARASRTSAARRA